MDMPAYFEAKAQAPRALRRMLLRSSLGYRSGHVRSGGKLITWPSCIPGTASASRNQAVVNNCHREATREQTQARRQSNSEAGFSGRSEHSFNVAQAVVPRSAPLRPPTTREWQFLTIGAFLALAFHVALQWMSHLPFWQRIIRRFIWWKDGVSPDTSFAGGQGAETTALTLYNENAESVEWFNMCWRKMWRVYQRGLERWLADLLQPVFDNLVAEVAVPRFVQRLRILEFTLDHEAPTFSQMRRRSSRKDSDLNGVVNVRYTGGARMLLLIEVGQGRWRFKLPVLVSDLDLECKLWIKVRLAPMAPHIGTIALAFVGPPNIKVQLLPYNHVRLMRIPVLQPFLTKLLTVDLPGLMVLPKRLEINIPPAVTAVAEAAVGHDAVMRAVASAVLQADALEHALIAALPLGPQSAAGGVSLPDSFHGELQVNLLEARNLPVWGFPWQSNPYCRLILGSQAVRSRRDDDTSHAGSHRAPVWNQEFQFLVEDPMSQVLEVHVRDSHLTGRADLGYVKFPLSSIPPDGHISSWIPVQPWTAGQKAEGELHLTVTYKPFEDDETDTGYREAEAYALMLQEQAITDIKSAADASSRAAVAASAAAAAVAVTKAAAARAAAKAALNAKARARQKRLAAEAEKQDRGSKRLDRRLSKKDRVAVLAAKDAKSRELGAGSSGSGGVGTDSLASIEGSESDIKGPLDPLALQDISPEDLFPPVSFSINDRADEDMPYTKPVAPESAEKPAAPKSADKGKGKPEAEGRGAELGGQAEEKRRPLQAPPKDGPTSEKSRATAVSGSVTGDSLSRHSVAANEHASSEREARNGTSSRLSGADDRSKPRSPTILKSSDDLPLVLSTLESASVEEALSLDSNISEVIEAVANGDIKAFGGDRFVELSASDNSSSKQSVGRGPVKHADKPPTQVDASVEFTANDATTAESARKLPVIPGGKSVVSLKQDGDAAEQPSEVQEPGKLKQLLSRVPFLGDTKSGGGGGQSASDGLATETGKSRTPQSTASAKEVEPGEAEKEKESWWARVKAWLPYRESAKAAEAASKPRGGGAEEREPVSEDTIKDVVVADELQLEAIAEEVQNSWRLKEIRAEQLMQKAVARSERPWLILLSSLFTTTVVLLGLVLYRLYDLNKDILGLLLFPPHY